MIDLSHLPSFSHSQAYSVCVCVCVFSDEGGSLQSFDTYDKHGSRSESNKHTM